MLTPSALSLSRQMLRPAISRASNLTNPGRASSSLSFRPAFPQPSLRILRPVQRLFSVGPVSHSAGETDTQLINKLEAEISYEKKAGSTDEPQWLKSFKEDGTFKIHHKPGSDEVILTRTFANENIHITFSCSDSEDSDEMDEGLEDASEDDGKDAVSNSRIRAAISIIKPGKGGMVIDCTTDGSAFDIDNVSYYEDEKLALDDSADNDWKRRGLYFGPTFIDLDEELQQSFYEFLNERGIGSELAAIVMDLAEHKEQKEYVNWLSKIRNFIKA